MWGLAAFAVLQLALAAALERHVPELRDPEYGHKLARLRVLLVEQPARPLTLVLGSSRAATGLRPDALPADYGPTFNFAVAGAGPLITLLQLRRLLGEGIRPTRVVVEVMPPLLHQPGPIAEANRLPPDRLAWSDLSVLRPYWARPDAACLGWAAGRAVPWFTNRFSLLSCVAPRWLPWAVRQDRWSRLDRHGWMPYPFESVSPERYRHGLEHARREYAPCFHQFRISPDADRALRELLDLCRREGMPVLLLTMPESAAFRDCYPSAASVEIRSYLGRLTREYGVPWIDARAWLADDRFSDGHHLLPSGATEFTERLGREWPFCSPHQACPVPTPGGEVVRTLAPEAVRLLAPEAVRLLAPEAVRFLAAEGRLSLARGANPWTGARNKQQAPEGRQ
jgi:hypothetical protein